MAGAYIPEGLWRDKRVTRNGKLLFGVLHSFTSFKGAGEKNVWPSQDLLADALQADPRTIRTWLSELKATGWVSTRRKVVGGLQLGLIYTLHLGDAELELEDDQAPAPADDSTSGTRRRKRATTGRGDPVVTAPTTGRGDPVEADPGVRSNRIPASAPELQRQNCSEGSLPPEPPADVPGPAEPAQGPSLGVRLELEEDRAEQVPLPLRAGPKSPEWYTFKDRRVPSWELLETPRARDFERKRQEAAIGHGEACGVCQVELFHEDVGFLRVWSHEEPIHSLTGKTTRKVVGMRLVLEGAVHLACAIAHPGWRPSTEPDPRQVPLTLPGEPTAKELQAVEDVYGARVDQAMAEEQETRKLKGFAKMSRDMMVASREVRLRDLALRRRGNHPLSDERTGT